MIQVIHQEEFLNSEDSEGNVRLELPGEECPSLKAFKKLLDKYLPEVTWIELILH